MVDAWRSFFHRYMGEWPEQHWAFGGRRFTPWHKGDVSFNPFVANLFSQGGGLLPLIMLHLLAEKPRYGNEIMSLLSEKTSGQWVANPGAIYPLMTELEDRGLVTGVWEDPRKRTVRIYHLTEFGERELKRVTSIVRPKLDEAIEVLQGLVSDLQSAATSTDQSDEGETKQ
jgi:DNA-binding PadR family transcriptional regulator